ncbi:MAG: hypothetical protein Q4G62_12060 [Pseudomonadota bacterium]|nr:hypothetical protein [Pseudomonadota bacterium]
MPRPSFARRSQHLAAAALLIATTGCSSAMNMNPSVSPDQSNSTNPPEKTLWKWPLRFTAHNFSAYTYSTYGAEIRYGHSPFMKEPDDKLQISSASLGEKYPNNMQGSHLSIRNFPPPAIVTWRSQDGTPHRAEVDMADIFKDGLIRHNLRREEIANNTNMFVPDIILEVNDRTINVYMRAHISTKALQKPGNKYSNFRNDLIKVYSKTY